MALKVPYFELNNGTKMPSVGIGCWLGSGEPSRASRAYEMVRLALKAGYRHIDTAYGYGNEEQVGKAIRDSEIPRNELYVTTKLPSRFHGSVQKGFEESFKNLGLEYIDLYLMHWPQADTEDGKTLPPDVSPTFVETWLEMEKLLKTGKVRSIGVSNFSVKNLETLLKQANIVPVTNQVEIHPCLPQIELKAYCDEHKILLTAYSPFGQPDATYSRVPFFRDHALAEIASKYDVSVGQILVSFHVKRGIAVIPKSEKEERIVQNATLVDLSDEDLQLLLDYHKQPGMHRSLLSYNVGNKVFGWTYEQLGWPMSKDGWVIQDTEVPN